MFFDVKLRRFFGAALLVLFIQFPASLLPGNSELYGVPMQHFNPDVYERLDMDVRVQTDGSLLIKETRRYNIYLFREYFPADIIHGNHRISDLEVFFNDEKLEEAESQPAFSYNPEDDAESRRGFVLEHHNTFKTLIFFGRFGEFELRLRYRIEGAVENAGRFAFLNYTFADARPRGTADNELRWPVRRDWGKTLEIRFEQQPEEVPFARLLADMRRVPVEFELTEQPEVVMRMPPYPNQLSPTQRARVLFSFDAVPDLPATAALSNVTVESLEAEYESWVNRLEEAQQREERLAGKSKLFMPAGWVMLLLCLYTIFSRRSRNRKRKKKVKELDFDQELTLADIRKLPGGVVNTLYSVDTLQPRNRVHRLTGLALIDLARAGHIKMEIYLPQSFLSDPDIIPYFRENSFREMLPFGVKKIIENAQIRILPLEDKQEETIRPWHKVLLAYIRNRCKGEAIELKALFPTKTKLQELRKTGNDGEKQAEELRNVLKMLKETLRETFFEDLEDGLGLFEEKRNSVYICLIALLVSVYFMALESFMGLFLFVFAAPALLFALLNRYELTAEGLRYSKKIREHINWLRKNGIPADESENPADLVTDFMVLNWPQLYSELHNRPDYPIFAKSPKHAKLVLQKTENISFGPEPDIELDRVLHYSNYVMQDTCLRSFMHYVDFVASDPGFFRNVYKGQVKKKKYD